MSDSGRAVFLRAVLFTATGAAVPFYAFPVWAIRGRHVDLATILAALFVVASLPALTAMRSRLPLAIAGASVVVPLLCLLPPRPAWFSRGAFAVSYAHWLLIVAFFLSASVLVVPARRLCRIVLVLIAVGIPIAAFGIYHVFGIPRGWPATGLRLVRFQRQEAVHMLLGSYIRPVSVFLEPAWLGGYLAWTLAIALAVASSALEKRSSRIFASAASALFAMTIFATVSLGVYADLAALAIVFAWRLNPVGRRATLAVAGIVLVLAAVFLATPWGTPLRGALAARYQTFLATPETLRVARPEVTESSWVRVRNAARSWEQIRQHPVRGVGLGNFTRSFSGTGVDPAVVPEAWCGWLAIAVEMGIAGPFILIAALWLGVRGVRAIPADVPPALAVPALLAIAVVQQLHTASFIDLWWWYPVSLAGVLAGAPAVAAGARGDAVLSGRSAKNAAADPVPPEER